MVTTTETQGAPKESARETRPYLVLSLMAQAPQAPKLCLPVGDGLTIGMDQQLDRLPAGASCRQITEQGTRWLLLPDRRCSRRHASVARDRTGVTILDRESKNGTYVNGLKLDSRPRTLVDGDRIEIGRAFFVYRELTAPVCDVIIEPPADDTEPTMKTFVPALAAGYRLLGQDSKPVLILGPPGTGKEHLAEKHRERLARRGRNGRFEVCNCAAIPEGLVEQTLFGARKGSFTGAVDDVAGVFELADRGTLFLDEIGELPLKEQAKLLRAIEYQEIKPVGGRTKTVDVAVVCATNADLPLLVDAGRFREDLYERISGVVIRTRPLTDRREDIGLIIAASLRRLAAADLSLDLEVGRLLTTCAWRGNIRRLVKALEFAVRMLRRGSGTEITLEHLQGFDWGLPLPPVPAAAVTPPGPEVPADGYPKLAQMSREQLVALWREYGSARKIAAALGRKKNDDVARRLRELGIVSTDREDD